MHQLATEVLTAPLVPGQRRDRSDHIKAAGIAPEPRFQAPEGNDEFRVHAVLGADSFQKCFVIVVAVAGIGDQFGRNTAGHVFFIGRGALRLPAVKLDHARNWLQTR